MNTGQLYQLAGEHMQNTFDRSVKFNSAVQNVVQQQQCFRIIFTVRLVSAAWFNRLHVKYN